jgi:peptidoglycan/LPS O-acetylase OafA/YrhL
MKKLTLLESLRGFASVYVALGHWLFNFSGVPAYLSLPFRFGQEAVIIFFILSGVVIFYSYEKGSDKTLKTYFIKRGRRIFFPLIFALAVSIIFVSRHFSLKELAGNLLMLQDFGLAKPGNIVNPFLGNLPLWSLSYEWTFYLIFPFMYPVIKTHHSRVHIVGLFSVINLIAYILFPNHLFLTFSYFLIWWTGLELGEYFFGVREKFQHKILLFYYLLITGILSITCVHFYVLTHSTRMGLYPLLLLRHFGFAFLCFACAMYLTPVTKVIVKVLMPFSAIAPISYGIYILHYPICVQTHFDVPIFAEIIIKIALVLGLAYIIEVKLQPLVNKLLTHERRGVIRLRKKKDAGDVKLIKQEQPYIYG